MRLVEMRLAALRASIALVGLLLGGAVYLYGTFHTLQPARAEIEAVASCGDTRDGTASDASRPSIQTDDALTYCLDRSGAWRVTKHNNSPFFMALVIAFGSTILALHRTRLMKWFVSSPLGHLALGMMLFGVPFALLGIQMNFIEGTLTSSWAFQVIAYGVIAGGAIGLVLWYAITARRIKK